LAVGRVVGPTQQPYHTCKHASWAFPNVTSERGAAFSIALLPNFWEEEVANEEPSLVQIPSRGFFLNLYRISAVCLVEIERSSMLCRRDRCYMKEKWRADIPLTRTDCMEVCVALHIAQLPAPLNTLHSCPPTIPPPYALCTGVRW